MPTTPEVSREEGGTSRKAHKNLSCGRYKEGSSVSRCAGDGHPSCKVIGPGCSLTDRRVSDRPNHQCPSSWVHQIRLLHLPVSWAWAFPPHFTFRNSWGQRFSVSFLPIHAPLARVLILSLFCPPEVTSAPLLVSRSLRITPPKNISQSCGHPSVSFALVQPQAPCFALYMLSRDPRQDFWTCGSPAWDAILNIGTAHALP